MKMIPGTLLLLAGLTSFFTVTGCATSRSEALRLALQGNKRVAICSIASRHTSTAGQVIPLMPIVGGIIYEAEKDKKKSSTAAEIMNLDTECLNAIQADLEADPSITYIPVPEARFEERTNTVTRADSRNRGRNVTVEKEDPKLDGKAVQKVCLDNSLGAAIGIELTYTFGYGYHKCPKMDVTWLVFTTDGKRQKTIQTSCEGGTAIEVLPNSRNPKYHEDYVALAKRNALSFLAHFKECAGCNERE